MLPDNDDDNDEFRITPLDRAFYRASCLLQNSWDFAVGNNRLYTRGIEPHMPWEGMKFAFLSGGVMLAATHDADSAVAAACFVMTVDIVVNGQVEGRRKARAYDAQKSGPK